MLVEIEIRAHPEGLLTFHPFVKALRVDFQVFSAPPSRSLMPFENEYAPFPYEVIPETMKVATELPDAPVGLLAVNLPGRQVLQIPLWTKNMGN